ncbi:hypothetical protein DSUL_40128 [Desulfovibrionales bacterium]
MGLRCSFVWLIAFFTPSKVTVMSNVVLDNTNCVMLYEKISLYKIHIRKLYNQKA